MNSLTTIYKIYSPSLSCELVLPSINDVKLMLYEQEELFDLLLLNKVQILPEQVYTDSKKYQLALHNKMIKPVK